jgi:hypothetical protein
MKAAILIIVGLTIAGCSLMAETIVFSSRSSPNGKIVAENVAIDDGQDGIGQLRVRSTSTTQSQQLPLRLPDPEMFLRWTDDEHLEIWRSSVSGDHLVLSGPFANLQIVEKTYNADQSDSFSKLALTKQTVVVPTNGLRAEFRQIEDRNGKHCRLSIDVPSAPSHEHASVEIEFRVWRLNAREKHADISTNFKLENPAKDTFKFMLTSATISDIPSYNRLPEGTEGTMIRGQFLEHSAVALMDKLKSSSIQLEYSRNFFGQIVVYDIQTFEIKQQTDQLLTCIGDAKLTYAD